MNPNEPPPELLFPSESTFICFFRPINHLKNLLSTLKQVEESLQQVKVGISIEVNKNGIQFKIINNGDRLLALFTLLPIYDIAYFEFNDGVTYQIEYSHLIGLIENRKGNVDHILLYKIPEEPHLHCRYLDEEKKTRFNIAPLLQLQVPIEFNRQGCKPICTVVVSCNLWRNVALKLLGKRKGTDINQEVNFVVNSNMIKISTAKYDDTESCTYEQSQGNCQIQIEDEANEHEYEMYVPVMVEKPLIRASELTGLGVLRLYFDHKPFMTLSFENCYNGADRGTISFIYYPRVFSDFY